LGIDEKTLVRVKCNAANSLRLMPGVFHQDWGTPPPAPHGASCPKGLHNLAPCTTPSG
jgi:hypothetical protein